MCFCLKYSAVKRVMMIMGGFVGLTAALVIVMALVYNFSDTKEMIAEESEAMAGYIFGMILALGVVILCVAGCGCLTARKPTKCNIFVYASLATFFMIFMFILGGLIVEVHRYITESI